MEDFLSGGVIFNGVEIFSVADLCDVIDAGGVTVQELVTLLNQALPDTSNPAPRNSQNSSVST